MYFLQSCFFVIHVHIGNTVYVLQDVVFYCETCCVEGCFLQIKVNKEMHQSKFKVTHLLRLDLLLPVIHIYKYCVYGGQQRNFPIPIHSLLHDGDLQLNLCSSSSSIRTASLPHLGMVEPVLREIVGLSYTVWLTSNVPLAIDGNVTHIWRCVLHARTFIHSQRRRLVYITHPN